MKRFVISAARDADAAFENLNTTLKWKKVVEINTTPINTFPSDFFKIGGLFPYEPCREGHPVMYMRIRMHRKIPELSEPIQQFLFHTINRMDREVNGQGIVVVMDCSGAGYQNMDIDMLKALIDVSFKYFPFAVNKVIVYELSWVLSAFRRLAMTFIPATFKRIIVFCDKEGIKDHIAQENLPDFMGGTCERDYRQIPEGCPSVDTLAQERGFAHDDVVRIKSIFEPFLKEAEEEIAKRPRVHYPQNTKPETELESSSDSGISGAEENSNDEPLALVTSQAGNKSQREEFVSVFPQNIINFAKIRALNSSGSGATPYQGGICGTVLVRNTRDVAIAFKVQTTQSELFTVSPSAGILMAGAWIRIVIRGRRTPESVTINENGFISAKFLLLFCTTPSDAEKHVQSRRAFDVLFTDAAAQNRLVTHRLQSRISCDTANSEAEDGGGSVALKKTSSPNKDKQQIQALERQFAALARSQRRLNVALLIILALFLILILLACAALISGEFFKFSTLKPDSARIEL